MKNFFNENFVKNTSFDVFRLLKAKTQRIIFSQKYFSMQFFSIFFFLLKGNYFFLEFFPEFQVFQLFFSSLI